jgi:hypothetical protein
VLVEEEGRRRDVFDPDWELFEGWERLRVVRRRSGLNDDMTVSSLRGGFVRFSKL